MNLGIWLQGDCVLTWGGASSSGTGGNSDPDAGGILTQNCWKNCTRIQRFQPPWIAALADAKRKEPYGSWSTRLRYQCELIGSGGYTTKESDPVRSKSWMIPVKPEWSDDPVHQEDIGRRPTLGNVQLGFDPLLKAPSLILQRTTSLLPRPEPRGPTVRAHAELILESHQGTGSSGFTICFFFFFFMNVCIYIYIFVAKPPGHLWPEEGSRDPGPRSLWPGGHQGATLGEPHGIPWNDWGME